MVVVETDVKLGREWEREKSKCLVCCLKKWMRERELRMACEVVSDDSVDECMYGERKTCRVTYVWR